MLKVLPVSILMICLIFAGACERRSHTPEPNGSVIKIGLIAPLSGPEQRTGESALSGIQTILTMSPYLRDGTKVELITEDNVGTIEETLPAFRRLHDREDVVGILLMAKSDIVLSLVPIADHYKIPIMALIATHPEITKDNNFITQLGFDDIYQATIAALYIRDELLIGKAAVFSEPGNMHYSFLAQEFIRKFTAVGGEVARHITLDDAQQDMRNILEKLREDEIQMLYLAVSPEQVIRIAKSAKEIFWHPKMMGSDGLLSTIFLRYKNDVGLVNGMMATDFYSTALTRTEYGERVTQKFRKFYSEPGTTYTALSAEGTSIFQHAVERCAKKTDRTCVNLMLRNTDKFEGIFGKISIGHDGKARRPIFVNIIKGDELKFLVKVY